MTPTGMSLCCNCLIDMHISLLSNYNTSVVLELKFQKDFKAITYKQERNEESKLPVDYIRRGEIKIKYVVMKHVLPFLPGKSLMKFQSVSNEWNHWIISQLVPYRQSISFQKLPSYFSQIVDVDFHSNPNFLFMDQSANGIHLASLHFFPERIKTNHDYLFCTYS